MSKRTAKVLVAEDDRAVRFSLTTYLRSEGYRIVEAENGTTALAAVEREQPDAVLLDLRMPGLDGLAVLAELGPRQLADLPVIVVTAFGGSAPAIEAMRCGAYDYLTKPFDLDEVHLTLRRALRQRDLAVQVRDLRAREVPDDDEFRPGDPAVLVGVSLAMREVFKAIGRAAVTEEQVLIFGESGTGKELVASALHRNSPRADGPFVRVNCAALPEGLVESELFGHERGAFTGADRQAPAVSSGRRGERSSSTRSANCRSPPRQSCCGSCSNASSSGLAATRRCEPMRGFSLRPTATCRRRLPPGDSATISFTGLTSSGSRSLRCENVARTSSPSRGPSCTVWRRATVGPTSRWPPKPWRRSSVASGAGTSGNWKTSWRGRRSPPEVDRSCPSTLERRTTTPSPHQRDRMACCRSAPCSPTLNDERSGAPSPPVEATAPGPPKPWASAVGSCSTRSGSTTCWIEPGPTWRCLPGRKPLSLSRRWSF